MARGSPTMTSKSATVRLAVIDDDSSFLRVLSRRLDADGWEYRVHSASAAGRRAGGDEAQRAAGRSHRSSARAAGSSSSASAARCPISAVVVCTHDSTVAQRVRGLRLGADDWITKPSSSRRGHGADRGRRPPPPAQPAASRRRPARRRRDRDPRRSVPGFRRRPEPRAHPARVRARPGARRRQRPGDRARGDLPAGLGLRDGPRRSLGRRLRSQAAGEAAEALARAGTTSTRTSASATGSSRCRADPGALRTAPAAGRRARPSRAWSARTSPRPAWPSSAEPSRLTCASPGFLGAFTSFSPRSGAPRSQHALGRSNPREGDRLTVISKKWLLAAGTSAVLAFGVAACGDDDSSSSDGSGSSSGASDLSGEIAGAGASSQEAAQEAWIAGLQDANPDVTISYDPVGSGGGREQFIAGGVAYARHRLRLRRRGADRGGEALRRRGELVQVPAYISPIAIVYNLPDVDELQLDAGHAREDLQPGDHHLERPGDRRPTTPDAELPDTRITPVNRSDESGTTENFTEYLSKAAPRSGPTSRRRLAGQGRRGRRGHLGRGRGRRRRRGRDRLRRREPGRRPRHRQDQGRRRATSSRPRRPRRRSLEISPEDNELGGDQYVFAFDLDRTTDRPGHLPDRARLLPDRPARSTTRPTKPRSSRRSSTTRSAPRASRRRRRTPARRRSPRSDGADPAGGRRDRRLIAEHGPGLRRRRGPGSSSNGHLGSALDTTTNAGQILAAASGGSRRPATGSSPTLAVIAGVTILALLAGVAIFLDRRGGARRSPRAPPSSPRARASSTTSRRSPSAPCWRRRSRWSSRSRSRSRSRSSSPTSRRGGWRMPLGYIVDLLAAIPSIVYGLWGIFVLGPAAVGLMEWLEEHLGFIPLLRGPGLGRPAGRCWSPAWSSR